MRRICSFGVEVLAVLLAAGLWWAVFSFVAGILTEERPPRSAVFEVPK